MYYPVFACACERLGEECTQGEGETRKGEIGSHVNKYLDSMSHFPQKCQRFHANGFLATDYTAIKDC